MFSIETVKNYFDELLAIDSPSGMTKKASCYIEQFLQQHDLPVFRTNKGAIYTLIKGSSRRAKCVVSHIDTLGAMITIIQNDGKICLDRIGGVNIASVEGNEVLIYTRNKGVLSGTMVPQKNSVHVFGVEAHQLPRVAENMTIRLHEKDVSFNGIKELGIDVGDMITFPAKALYLDNGYIVSRFIDDKLCVAIVLAYIDSLTDNKILSNDVFFFFSDYEEVGHGLYALPDSVEEVLAIDVAPTGGDHASRENKVSIIAKDKFTVYDYYLRRRLEKLAEKEAIPFCVETYNNYGSDASVAAIQGFDFRFACMGPGTSGSHHIERTHSDALKATYSLLSAYLTYPIPENSEKE